MIRTRQITLLLLASLFCGWATVAVAGGRHCAKCGGKEKVKPVCRLVKVCQEVDIPNYAALKRESFYPDKGAICHTGYRCETIYDFWREPPPAAKGKSQQRGSWQTHPKHPPPPLHSTCHTVCSCRTDYGAKPTGHHKRTPIRKRVGSEKYVVPVLKWETTHLCRDCCKRQGKEK